MKTTKQPKRKAAQPGGLPAASGYVARSEWMHDIHGRVRIMHHYASYGLVWAKCLDQYGKNRLLSCNRLSPHTDQTNPTR
jgi:hypothetical protein